MIAMIILRYQSFNGFIAMIVLKSASYSMSITVKATNPLISV